MTTKDRFIHGGAAFPCSPAQVLGADYEPRMTLRDYFAAAALTGIMANEPRPDTASEAAAAAYEVADVMLLERGGDSQP